jgi:hypothetical protein
MLASTCSPPGSACLPLSQPACCSSPLQVNLERIALSKTSLDRLGTNYEGATNIYGPDGRSLQLRGAGGRTQIRKPYYGWVQQELLSWQAPVRCCCCRGSSCRCCDPG